MVADAQSGVTLRIEFQRGQVVHAKQKWFSEFGHTIAQSMRLTEPWHGSNRAYAADSWFGSVTAKEVLSEVDVRNRRARLALTLGGLLPGRVGDGKRLQPELQTTPQSSGDC